MSLYRCTFRVPAVVLDALSECLFEAGAEGLEEGPGSEALTTYVQSPEHAEPLLAAFAVFRTYVAQVLPECSLADPEIELIDDHWQDKWLEALEPQALTASFVLRPTTRRPAPPGERTIWFEPSASFGAGNHPTTRLAAAAIQARCEETPGLSLLDVGSGNGVLIFAGLLSGLARAVGVDTNPVAAQALTRNAALNGVSDRVTSLEGSLDVVDETFALIVANIDTRTLLALAPALARRLLPGGTLWLTGLLDEDADAVAQAFASQGLSRRRRAGQDGWALLELGSSDS